MLDKSVLPLKDVQTAVYQDFRQEVYQALCAFQFRLSKYSSITMCLPEGIHHPKKIIECKFYILYSPASGKTYTGFTNDIQRRLTEHNLTETKGFTLRFRPWQLIYQENLETKKEAMAREQFLKSGKGRELLKAIVKEFLEQDRMRYPPQAEKD